MTEVCTTEYKYQETENKPINNIADNLSDGIIIHCSGKIVYINSIIEILFGKTSADLLGKEHHVPAAQEDVLETTFRLPDGSVRFFDVNIIDTVWDSKPAMMMVYRDITKRKQIEDKLRKDLATFKMMAEKSRDVMFSLDNQGRFSYISPSIENLTGFKKEQVDGDYIWSLILDKDTASMEKALSEVCKNNKTCEANVKFHTFNRSFVQVVIYIHPLVRRGRLIGYYGVMTK